MKNEMGMQVDSGSLMALYRVCEACNTINHEIHRRLDHVIDLVLTGNSDVGIQVWQKYFKHVNIIQGTGNHFTVVNRPLCLDWMNNLIEYVADQDSNPNSVVDRK